MPVQVQAAGTTAPNRQNAAANSNESTAASGTEGTANNQGLLPTQTQTQTQLPMPMLMPMLMAMDSKGSLRLEPGSRGILLSESFMDCMKDESDLPMSNGWLMLLPLD
jgi:hypothetical protein